MSCCLESQWRPDECYIGKSSTTPDAENFDDTEDICNLDHECTTEIRNTFHINAFEHPLEFVEEGISDDDLIFHDELSLEESEVLNSERAGPKNSAQTTDDAHYRNAPVSVAESFLLIMTFANRHKITGKP